MMYGLGGWWMWIIGPAMIVLVVWLVASLARDTTAQSSHQTDAPRRILDDRLARGEIDRDEYLERLTVLERR